MDQFCLQDDVYKRCICSKRLDSLRDKERTLSQTATSLQNFTDYNIDAITKTAKEVAASLNATAGESTIAADKSAAAQKLQGISAVLGTTKQQALSTAGKLDIAGDVSAIWSAPSDFIGAVDISNMEGETLYNQVHSQCVDMVRGECGSDSTLNMVVSAYGMYIEQDCNIRAAALDGQTYTAAANIRQTGYDMNKARLSNYDAHNATAINDCIAQVRKDITTDGTTEGPCGANFVHCLDVSGMFLDFNTGDPIYSTDFFKLENAISMDGDILNSVSNRLTVAQLDDKKKFAERGLDTCRDIADDVWTEFKRQAVIEIYQRQQAAVKQVRDDCLQVINQCYDEKLGQLRQFVGTEATLMAQSVETAEALCKQKVDSCSNVFGSKVNLLAFVDSMGTRRISDDCEKQLTDYINSVCATANDLDHAYPYSCRMRAPGSFDKDSLPGSDGSDSTSIYSLLLKFAKENCARTDALASGDTSFRQLPTETLQAVNKVFDAVSLEMRLALKAECEKYLGFWYNYDATFDANNQLQTFVKKVGSHLKWGLCMSDVQCPSNESYRETDGAEPQCCPSGTISNCPITGEDATFGNQETCCILPPCPTNAGIDKITCNDVSKIFLGNPNRCIDKTNMVGSTDADNKWCRCNDGFYAMTNTNRPNFTLNIFLSTDDNGTCQNCSAYPNSHFSTMQCGMFSTGSCLQKEFCKCDTDYVANADQTSCVPDPHCPVNSQINWSCTSTSTGIGGCASINCKCNDGYVAIAGGCHTNEQLSLNSTKLFVFYNSSSGGNPLTLESGFEPATLMCTIGYVYNGTGSPSGNDTTGQYWCKKYYANNLCLKWNTGNSGTCGSFTQSCSSYSPPNLTSAISAGWQPCN